MIADDEAAIRESLERVLQVEGYDTSTVADGLAVLGGVGDDAPDLLILDVMTPRLGGVETCGKQPMNVCGCGPRTAPGTRSSTVPGAGCAFVPFPGSAASYIIAKKVANLAVSGRRSAARRSRR
ncbi:response regulator [Amycolatopsis sp. cmx-4-61]|uniref:response regulator n=1 Tax=Amycolatopsis sp. cmx-4-61 TaxID=2790937 RepID=UPI003978E05F